MILTGLVAVVGCNSQTLDEARAIAVADWQKSTAALRYKDAKSNFEYGHLEKAYQKSLQAYQMDPKNPKFAVLFSQVLIERGEYKKAQTELEYQKDLLPKNYEINYYLGVAYEKQGLYSAAVASWQAALSVKPGSNDAIRALAEALFLDGKPRQAVAFLERKMMNYDPDRGCYEILGRIALRCKMYDKAIRSFERACSMAPKKSLYLELLIEVNYAAGKYDSVIGVYQRLLEEKGYNATAIVLQQVGDSYFAIESFLRAEKLYKKIAKLNPTNIDAQVRLAKVGIATRKWITAMEYAETAVHIDPSNIEAVKVLAMTLMSQRQYKNVVKLLSKHARKSKCDEIYLMLGQAYAKTGDSRRASACIKQAKLINPELAIAK